MPKGKRFSSSAGAKKGTPQADLQQALNSAYGGDVRIAHSRQIARLWAGYGVVQEVSITGTSQGEKKIIVKQVLPVVDSSESSRRKL